MNESKKKKNGKKWKEKKIAGSIIFATEPQNNKMWEKEIKEVYISFSQVF